MEQYHVISVTEFVMGGESVKILVPAAKTPFLSFLEDGGFEKKYERVQFGREVFQKKVLS